MWRNGGMQCGSLIIRRTVNRNQIRLWATLIVHQIWNAKQGLECQFQRVFMGHSNQLIKVAHVSYLAHGE